MFFVCPNLVAGIYYSDTDLDTYLILIPPKYESVHVYDKLTGKKSKKKEKTLVEKGRKYYKFKDIEEENYETFDKRLAKLFNCNCQRSYDGIVFFPKGSKKYSSELFLSLNDLSKELKALMKLKERIEKTGFMPAPHKDIVITTIH